VDLYIYIYIYIHVYTYIYIYTSIYISAHGWQTTQGFLPQLHEFYFTTDGNKILENCRRIVPEKKIRNNETLQREQPFSNRETIRYTVLWEGMRGCGWNTTGHKTPMAHVPMGTTGTRGCV
jgi:hypothetical protein